MRKAVLFIFLTTASLVYAQVVTPIAKNEAIGQKTDGSPLMAETLDFGKTLYDVQPNPKGERLLLMFRERNKKDTEWKKTGSMGLLTLRTQEMEWSEFFNYSDSWAYNTDKGVLMEREGTLILKDPYKGLPCWDALLIPVAFNQDETVVLGYSYDSGILRAYSIKEGLELWSARASAMKNNGWEQMLWEDSTHIVVANNDLCRIDVRTGDIDVFEVQTSITDIGSVFASSFAALGLTVASGFNRQYMPVSSGKLISGLHSNILIDDTCFYFSDRKHIAKVNRQMQPLWETELPAKSAAHTLLSNNKDKVCMINLGFGLKGNNLCKAGRPFVASYDKQTGHQLFMNQLSEDKNVALDAYVCDDLAYVVFEDSLCSVSLNDGHTIAAKRWDEIKRGSLLQVMRDTLFAYDSQGQRFVNIAVNGDLLPIQVANGDVYLLDKQLNIQKRLKSEEHYIVFCRWRNRLFMQQLDKQAYWVSDSNQKALSQLSVNIEHFRPMDQILVLQTRDKIILYREGQ